VGGHQGSPAAAHDPGVALHAIDPRDRCQPLTGPRPEQTYLIERTAEILREAGFDVAVSVDAAPRAMEEAEAERAERLEARAERLHGRAERLAGPSRTAAMTSLPTIAERRPFGQPILVGHHSERGARADQRRIESNMDKFVELAAESRQTESAAQAAERHMAHRENPRVTARRIERLEADKRRAEKYLAGWSERHLAGDGKRVLWTDTHAPAEGAYREQLLTQVEHLTEQLRYWREQLDQAKASGRYNPVELSEIHKGDLIRTRFGWKRVVRVNKKTVSVETGYSWTDKYEVTDILEHQSAAAASV
jgi:hypothetical protein